MNSATSPCFRKERCACGQRGCTETYASCCPVTPILRRQWHQRFSAKDVISRAAAGDLSRRNFQDAIVALGRALVSYILLMDPELIVRWWHGRSGAALLQPLIREVQAGLAWRPAPRS